LGRNMRHIYLNICYEGGRADLKPNGADGRAGGKGDSPGYIIALTTANEHPKKLKTNSPRMRIS